MWHTPLWSNILCFFNDGWVKYDFFDQKYGMTRYFKIMIRYLFTLICKHDLKSVNVFRRGYYDDQSVRELMAKRKDFVKRRLCILPTMSCNLRPNYCCPNTTCRCNLWGQNCRYIYTAQIPFTISQWIHCNLQMPHLIVR